MTTTRNTHDKGALFGFDGVNMWIEQTLDTAPAAIEYTPEGVAKVGRWWVHSFDPSPQSEPELFTSEELALEVSHLMRLNRTHGRNHLRTAAYMRLQAIIEERK